MGGGFAEGGDAAGATNGATEAQRDSLIRIRLTVNGEAVELSVEPRRLLVDIIRDDLDLTGTKVGCDTSSCGTCTVHLDGRAVKSCTVLAVQADGSMVRTVEDLAPDPSQLHPLQAAFVEHHGLQCGFCTPGMLMTALDLLGREPDPDDGEIRHALHGNLCRCTGYQSIVDSIREGAAVMRGEPARSWSDVRAGTASAPNPSAQNR